MNELTAIASPSLPLCVAKLFKMAFDGHDLKPLRHRMTAQIESGCADAAAYLNLSVIDQLLGDQVAGLKHQAEALGLQRLYRSSWPTSKQALHMLAFMAPGDIGTNTPIEFLVEDSDVVLHMLYVIPGQDIPGPLPDHDVAIVTVSESDRNRPVLREIERMIPLWPCPVLNPPGAILNLSRERMSSFLRSAQDIMMPTTVRVNRVDLGRLYCGSASIDQFLQNGSLPLIIRPIDSHAGRSLVKLDSPSSIATYLAGQQATEFFISRFIDYRSSDGLFRKCRILWVDGQPFPCHMAISDDWKVWYYNAGMAASLTKRQEESRFMETFDSDFALRHSTALADIANKFKLEYFGIDCAELRDGRLLVFEGDIALVVHDMDTPDLYAYKSPHMQRLFAAFRGMLHAKSLKKCASV